MKGEMDIPGMAMARKKYWTNTRNGNPNGRQGKNKMTYCT
jgi:hypothetical protein